VISTSLWLSAVFQLITNGLEEKWRQPLAFTGGGSVREKLQT